MGCNFSRELVIGGLVHDEQELCRWMETTLAEGARIDKPSGTPISALIDSKRHSGEAWKLLCKSLKDGNRDGPRCIKLKIVCSGCRGNRVIAICVPPDAPVMVSPMVPILKAGCFK